MMFTATYPASFLPEDDGKGYHVRFPDFPEALTGGDDLQDTLVQAADCLAEAIAGRITRRDEIPVPSKPKRGQKTNKCSALPCSQTGPVSRDEGTGNAEHRACQAPGSE